MELKINSYKLTEVKKTLINKVLTDFPDKTIKEKAELIGVSERSLYRYLKTKKKIIQIL